MKKIAIITALLVSSIFLSACSNTVEEGEQIISTGEITETTDTGDIIETTETLDTVLLTGEMIENTGNAVIVSGNEETIMKIKTLIDNRKQELLVETGTKKELTEKDIDLLESIVNELSQKK